MERIFFFFFAGKSRALTVFPEKSWTLRVAFEDCRHGMPPNSEGNGEEICLDAFPVRSLLDIAGHPTPVLQRIQHLCNDPNVRIEPHQTLHPIDHARNEERHGVHSKQPFIAAPPQSIGSAGTVEFGIPAES